ncbi:hypothetical protein CRYUN_Cryun27aG0120500 [Craigia yunnanensis]
MCLMRLKQPCCCIEKAEAEGRYLCSSRENKTKALVEKLKSKYPVYNYPKRDRSEANLGEIAEFRMEI